MTKRPRCLPLVLLPMLACGESEPRPNATFGEAASAADASETGDGDGDGAPGDGDGAPGDGDGDGDGDPIKFDQSTQDFPAQTCDPDQIPDTTAFSFVKTIELGIDTLQAGFYDSTRDRVVVFSFFGQGKILDIDGNILADVNAPPEALPKLDGAAYDLGSDLALLITQDCNLVEVNPETFATSDVIPLGLAHAMEICAGLAIDPLGNLYIASYGTDELVILDRTGQIEIDRIDMLAIGVPGFDGIAEIAGSDNFLVNSTTQFSAAIIAGDGTLLAGPGAIGDMPIMGGGMVGQPDSMLTICTNGHTWVCDAYQTSCSDFAPSDGDKTACGCLVVE